jgi:hypothetical protein
VTNSVTSKTTSIIGVLSLLVSVLFLGFVFHVVTSALTPANLARLQARSAAEYDSAYTAESLKIEHEKAPFVSRGKFGRVR